MLSTRNPAINGRMWQGPRQVKRANHSTKGILTKDRDTPICEPAANDLNYTYLVLEKLNIISVPCDAFRRVTNRVFFNFVSSCIVGCQLHVSNARIGWDS